MTDPEQRGPGRAHRPDAGQDPPPTRRGPHFSPRLMVRGLAWDVGLPLVAYYALHFLGASDWVALLTASCAAALRIVWAAVRDRRLNLFAVVMLVVFGVGLALAFVGGDPRFLLLKDSFVTGAVGPDLRRDDAVRPPADVRGDAELLAGRAESLAAALPRRCAGPARLPADARGCGASGCCSRRRCGCRWSSCCRSA